MVRPVLDPHPTDQVPALVQRLYSLVSEFESLFPGRRFTPDGHLVGSIGEVIAAYRYRLKLSRPSTKGHDATATDGRKVEVKATQGGSVALRSEPVHLLVLFIGKDGNPTEIFNGPGPLAWDHCGSMQKNGQRSISLTKLGRLMEGVEPNQRLEARD